MFKASTFRAEKARAKLTNFKISKGAGVGEATVVRLLSDDKNASVALGNARKVRNFLTNHEQQRNTP